MKGKLIHTMIRVGNLERSVNFYCNVLGMKELRREENENEEYTLVFLGYGEENRVHCLELTYNYGIKFYDKGKTFGHVAIAVENCDEAAKEIALNGGIVTRKPGKVIGGEDYIAFCQDPEGNKIELIEKNEGWFSAY